MKPSKRMGILSAVTALVVTSASLEAAVLLSSPSGDIDNGDYEIGYRFTPTNNILVQQLAFIDLGSVGLASSHAVTLWEVVDGSTFGSGIALGSVTVQAGTASPSIGGFRYESLSTPITLTAGTAYVLSASTYAGGDEWYSAGPTSPSFTLGLPVTMNGGQFGVWYYPNYPNYFPGDPDPYITANLLGEVLVPEPSAALLLAVGGWWVFRRRSH